MKYEILCHEYQKLESTSKRLEKTFIISQLLLRTKEADIETTIQLLQGRVFPVWDPRKVGVAAKLVSKAISLATGRSAHTVETQWKKTGDLGIVAEKLTEKKRQATLFQTELTAKKVKDNLQKLASMTGSGTVQRKVGLISELLTSAKPIEAKYVVRTVLEDLRVGVAAGTLRDAIVWAYQYDVNYDEVSRKIDLEQRADYMGAVDKVQNAYNLCNDFPTVALAAKKDNLESIRLEIGRPVQVMLGPKEKTIEEAFKRVGKPAALEYKYDGFRMLIHKQGKDLSGRIRIFTRRLEDVTAQFPEVVRNMQRVKADSFIIDGEAVGYSSSTGKYLPFQSISQRIRRKYNIGELSKRMPVEFTAFDMLYLDGKSLIDDPFEKRRQMLSKIVLEKEKELVLSKQIITDSEGKAREFFEQSKKAGNEGIMFKSLQSPYKPGSRVGYMVKYKEAMETLDLVVVGAEWGEGKRKGWLTSFILACRSQEGLRTIGKVGTGIKELEEQGLTFHELTEMLRPHITREKGREVLIKPAIVLEIQFEEIQKSPTYESGYALRFPRVVRDRTMEKGIEQASDLGYVEELYSQQAS